MAKYLDTNGLVYLWQKISEKFVAKEAGKGLSTNDYTTTEKEKLGAIPGIKSIGAGLELTEDGALNATQGGKADSVEWTGVLNTPTTLAGYGITDAASSDHNHDDTYLKLSGGTMTGPIQFSADQGQIALDADTAAAKIEMDTQAAEIIFTNKQTSKTNRMTVSATGAEIAVGETSPGDGSGTKVTIDETNGVKIPMVATPVNERDAANKKYVDDSVAPKANSTDVYKKTETYSKTEIDKKGFLTEHQDISGKADKATTLAGYGIEDAYTKTETDSKIDEKIVNKADKATTLAGYGIGDAYTKTETDSKIDEKIAGKADKATTLEGYGITDAYTKSETYTKTEVDGKLSSVYKPAGNCLFANLPTPSASNLGNVYSMMDEFTTDNRFIASVPTHYPIGTNVVVVLVEPDTYKFDVLSGFVDLSPYMLKTDMVAITTQEIDQIISGTI